MSILYIRDSSGKFVPVPAIRGKNAYEYAKEGGYTGTEAEFTKKMAEELEIAQSTGSSPTAVMSQKAVTDAIGDATLAGQDGFSIFLAPRMNPEAGSNIIDIDVSEVDLHGRTLKPGDFVLEKRYLYQLDLPVSQDTFPATLIVDLKGEDGDDYVLTAADKAAIAQQAAGLVNIPSKPSDIGLGNVDNEKQYSASNPPPYPVTRVNGKTGDVALSFLDLKMDIEQWAFELEDGSTAEKLVVLYVSTGVTDPV